MVVPKRRFPFVAIIVLFHILANYIVVDEQRFLARLAIAEKGATANKLTSCE
jgi:hypothetical protein